MIPRLRPNLGKAEWRQVLKAEHCVVDFESECARALDVKHTVAFAYGRTAMMALFEAAQIKNKEIICPSYTCVVVAHAIILSGNTPVFVDSEADGFNMCMEKARAASVSRGGQTAGGGVNALDLPATPEESGASAAGQ